jgi:fused signal recognition particle receptor
MGFFDFFKRNTQETKENLDKGLDKTKQSFLGKIARAILGKSTVDDEVLDNLEEVLITSDVGVETTLKIIDRIQARVSKDKVMGTDELQRILREEIASLLEENNSTNQDQFSIPETNGNPYVIMVVGVNGVGKTTTIGKLAYQFKQAGLKVVLGASDTFRAAAVDQLQTWGSRIGVDVITGKDQSEPASVAFDAATFAKENSREFLIVDTAGRLHNKNDLMNELGKVKRVVEKVAPVTEVLLVIDATTGQNAMAQAKVFSEAVSVTGLIVTKMDGSAKGGIALAIEAGLGIPIKFIGTGESIEDFAPFEPQLYIQSLLDA